jgi:HSP20 family protein
MNSQEENIMYRRYRYPSFWREFDRLQREINQLSEPGVLKRGRGPVSFPAVNIWTNDDKTWVTAEVPGVDPKEIEISIVGSTLTISGSRNPEESDENSRYHRQERGYGKFSRPIQLPFNVDANKVEANFKDGILSINLPRAEEDKPRKISVKSA